MLHQKNKIKAKLADKSLLKVIAGINNFDLEQVMKIAAAANHTNADLIDICADENIINEVLNAYPELAVCVSSVTPAELLRAEELGATMLELGNYEALHEEGIYLSAAEVFSLASEIVTYRKQALVSITVPGHISIAEQIKLAIELEELGVDVIQTEGAAQVTTEAAGALGQIEKVKLTLASTVELTKNLNETAVMTASGITPDTLPMALAAGANGVGVGKYVNKLNNELEMVAAILGLQQSFKKASNLVNA
jgi:hypothetical protein